MINQHLPDAWATAFIGWVASIYHWSVYGMNGLAICGMVTTIILTLIKIVHAWYELKKLLKDE